jgi:hypothetical protein
MDKFLVTLHTLTALIFISPREDHFKTTRKGNQYAVKIHDAVEIKLPAW